MSRLTLARELGAHVLGPLDVAGPQHVARALAVDVAVGRVHGLRLLQPLVGRHRVARVLHDNQTNSYILCIHSTFLRDFYGFELNEVETFQMRRMSKNLNDSILQTSEIIVTLKSHSLGHIPRDNAQHVQSQCKAFFARVALQVFPSVARLILPGIMMSLS